jgi:Na+/H+ antiporter NhaD/arsenite permease-like protein
VEAALPVISLIALVIVVVLSIVTNVNVGAMALAAVLIVGYFIGGQEVGDLIKGFPIDLFIMLAGVTYLFSIASVNGTMDKIAMQATKAVRGNTALLRIIFFFVAFFISAIGPGQITTSALMAPAAMALAAEVGISPLLMALVVGNGAQAGAMSPLAPPGIIVAGLTKEMGLTGVSGILWLNMLIAHVIVALIAYLVFGGIQLWRKKNTGELKSLQAIQVEPFTSNQIITIIGILALVIMAVFFKVHIGLGAFLVGIVLAILKVGDEGKAIKSMPWATIVMVTGVTVLVKMMSDIGGMDLFASIIASVSTPGTVTLVAGFISGIVSAYASTTGVILPAFVPLAPSLVEQLGGIPDLMAVLSSIIVCGFLTDLSPLSTTGALFLGAAPEQTDKTKLFRDMLIWGLSMSVVGAVVVWLLFGVIGLP